jgi:hypothetical protein
MCIPEVMLPGIVEIHLIAAQDFHLGTSRGRQLNVRSAHGPFRILALTKARAQEHGEGLVSQRRQLSRQCGHSGIGLRLVVDQKSHWQPGTRLQPRDDRALIVQAVCPIARHPTFPTRLQQMVVQVRDETDLAWVKGLIDSADPHRRVVG